MAQVIETRSVCDGRLCRIHSINAVGRRRGRIIRDGGISIAVDKSTGAASSTWMGPVVRLLGQACRNHRDSPKRGARNTDDRGYFARVVRCLRGLVPSHGP